jgi:transcriptional regulator with XRE-family HTH domain
MTPGRGGLSVTALARLAECTPKTLRRIESGEREPGRQLTANLNRALGIDLTTGSERRAWQPEPPTCLLDEAVLTWPLVELYQLRGAAPYCLAGCRLAETESEARRSLAIAPWGLRMDPDGRAAGADLEASQADQVLAQLVHGRRLLVRGLAHAASWTGSVRAGRHAGR